MSRWNEWDRQRFYRERTARAIDQGHPISDSEANVLESDPSFRTAVYGLVETWQEERNRNKLKAIREVTTLANTSPELSQSRSEDAAWLQGHRQLLESQALPLGVVEVFQSGIERATPEDIERIVEVGRIRRELLDKVLRDPEYMRRLTPNEFEQFICDLVHQVGFRNVKRTPASGDGGVDVVATKEMGKVPVSFGFECKLYKPERKVGPGRVRALLGSIEILNLTVGVLVTTSTLTRGGWELVTGHARLDGKDFNGIVRWLDAIREKE